jgi:hypothetical protein
MSGLTEEVSGLLIDIQRKNRGRNNVEVCLNSSQLLGKFNH